MVICVYYVWVRILNSFYYDLFYMQVFSDSYDFAPCYSKPRYMQRWRRLSQVTEGSVQEVSHVVVIINKAQPWRGQGYEIFTAIKLH